jgi:23S rRNA (adenine2503-C2)-methyltransferase
MDQRALVEHDVKTLEEALARRGFRPRNAKKALRIFYESAGQTDFIQLACARDLRDHLAGDLSALRSRELRRQTSADGTIKLLLAMARGGSIEAVLMPGYRDGEAAGCLSSQIGCAMSCDFCASTKSGLERNLEPDEMVEQFLHLKRAARAIERKLKTIVFMGMGEPMHNLDNVIAAIRRIADPDMGGVGWRQVTVSTVGIVPGIDALAEADLNVCLAVSLHAPDDQTRSRIVPINRRYPVAQVLAAARRFAVRTKRVPTIEYCMLDGVNDSDEQARMLARLLHGFRAHVNLIPCNWIGTGISGAIYREPPRQRMMQFLEILRQCGAVAHIRQRRGDDIAAACGQLRSLFPT